MDPGTLRGLSEQEAAARLKAEGFNELPSARPRSTLAIALSVLREPMFLLLVAAGITYLLLGDLEEAMALLVAIFVVIGITLYQERKTERALQALRDLSSPRALVIRDGVQKRIAGREVVRGDILVLSEGDRVPADAVLLSGVNLSVDESLLTGESAPVRKLPAGGAVAMGRPGGDDSPFLYSGTLVVRGRGIAQVQATGIQTELGKIGRALRALEPERPHLQTEIERLVRIMAAAGLSLCVLVALIYGATRGSWLNGILAGLTLAISMVPEEFPVVLTVFLALGAWRISRKRVLTRRIPAIEMLGSATVLCVDKTGTLTLNRMSVRRLFAAGQFYDVSDAPHEPLPENFHPVVEDSILASQRDPFDPMERAFIELGDRYLHHTEHLHRDWTLVREYPLSPGLLAISRVWQSPAADPLVVAAKGAPEAIAELCGLRDEPRSEILGHAAEMARQGLRVLGVARARLAEASLPDSQRAFDFQFVGLVGLTDPVRPGVAQAIQECYRAGIRVVMITGDYPVTAENVARQVGLQQAEESLTGPELDRMEEEALRRSAARINVFARVVPEQKLRLVKALKANGEVVAMTGDGVNDAPALKAAHIGIAMGERGTDVARESAALVLLDDDFSSIVAAVRLGRRIFDNLKKAMAFILAIHVPIAGVSLFPLLLKWPLILMPLHIVFVELIIDPACSIAFEAEPEETEIMERPPRNPTEPLFTRRSVLLSLFQGLSVLLMALAVFVVSMSRGQGELDARALTFTTLIIGTLALIFTNRSWSHTILHTLRAPNPALWGVTGSALVLLALVLYVPFFRDLFRFSTLHPVDIAICLAAGLLGVLWFEGFKLLRR
ncbi:MAG: cation-translocating P-type ATPase [Candidatus Tectomicrobia bacterium]|uniref:Cation-translocating P-type ATPase n=1 Tax=Tectimicrobiota bacterium TaxID=2528274 RepID=A0A932CP93_UNCTE|nr:cation-translocating P-type ATPase [Candidatus Tectomicrobia bacterium]